MAFIKGYLFKTNQAALNAIATINQGEGIPNNGYLTQTYCEPKTCVNGFYIAYDEITQKYLGTPIDIEIDLNNNL
jgi:hypothetical protein